jgi:predicted HTH transcriptional regulator
MLDEIQSLAKSKSIEFKQDLYDKDLKYIKAFTKAFIGRSLFGNEGSARVMLGVDNQFQKALTLFPEAEKISKNLSSLK